MELIKTNIDGLLLFKPDIFRDERGYFYESFNREKYDNLLKEHSLPALPEFVQDNQSKSSYGVLRGLHFQKSPYAQAKLVRVIQGSVLDVAVDIRASSPTFGKYFSVELTADNMLQFYIPEGFAHGFVVLSAEAIFQYKCSNYYNKESESGIIWNDTTIGIDWRIEPKDIILSPKDKLHRQLSELSDI